MLLCDKITKSDLSCLRNEESSRDRLLQFALALRSGKDFTVLPCTTKVNVLWHFVGVRIAHIHFVSFHFNLFHIIKLNFMERIKYMYV